MGKIEINSSSTVCKKCGTAYSRLKGYFPVVYAPLYKGTGHMPYCRDCIDKIYMDYLSDIHDAAMACRQTCRVLDIYWNEELFRQVESRNSTRSMMTEYITKINGVKHTGKSYDDTLREEGTLWSFGRSVPNDQGSAGRFSESSDEAEIEVPDGVIEFWGPGHTTSRYNELEERKNYWLERLPPDVCDDVGVQALLRQIVGLEIEINRDRAAGKSTDKQVKAFNDLLGSAKLKPAQKKDDADSAIDGTPLGVWIKRYENQRPIPDPDPEFKDVDGIVRYISIWFLGHLCKMLGIKNTYCKLYEDEIERLRIERPEYEDEDDETMFNDIFARDEKSED